MLIHHTGPPFKPATEVKKEMSSLLSTNSFVYKTPLTMYTHKRRILPRTTKHLFCTVVLRCRLLAIYSLVFEKLVTLSNPAPITIICTHDTCTQSPLLSLFLVVVKLFFNPLRTFHSSFLYHWLCAIIHFTRRNQSSMQKYRQTHTRSREPGLIHAPCSTNAALSLFARTRHQGWSLALQEWRKEGMDVIVFRRIHL